MPCCSRISRPDFSRWLQGAAQNIQQTGGRLFLVEKFNDLCQVPHILAGDGADNAPVWIASKPLHRFNGLFIYTLSFPVLAGAVSDCCCWRIQRDTYAYITANQKLHCFIVKKSGIGLNAKTKVILKLL